MNLRTIKLYTSRIYLPDNGEIVSLLLPFWRQEENSSIYAKYYEIASHLFEIVDDIRFCDYVILPGPIKHYRSFKERSLVFNLKNLSKAHNKKLLILNHGDKNFKNKDKNVILVQTSTHKKSNLIDSQTFTLPVFMEDQSTKYINENNQFRKFRQKPTVGFCGSLYKSFSLITSLKVIFKSYFYTSYLNYPKFRKQIIATFLKEKDLECNFLIRLKYLGNTKDQLLIDEFYKNIVDSDYTLCIRGAGNYSNRLYETVMMGRIPILIDTDCILPFADTIDYNKFCIIINSKAKNITKEFISKHKKFSGEKFILAQQLCRYSWEEYFTPEGFYKHFAKILVKSLPDFS